MYVKSNTVTLHSPAFAPTLRALCPDVDVPVVQFDASRQRQRRRDEVVAPCSLGPLTLVGNPSQYDCGLSTIAVGASLIASIGVLLALSVSISLAI
jgi:hypothetical protein